MTNAAETLDLHRLEALAAGETGLLRELVQLFVEDLPQRLAALRAAVASANAGAVEQSAHALKGMVANFTTGTAFETALRLERLGREGDLSGAKDLVVCLESEIRDLTTNLSEFTRLPTNA